VKKSKRLAVLASGSGTNLQALIDAGLGPRTAVVIVNNPGARATARAEAAGIPSALIDHRAFASREAFDEALKAELVGRGADFVVLAGFMRIIGSPVLDAFPRRIVNIHPSLLPAFPGLHAQRQALLAGVRVSGCTVHLVDAGCDSGPILAQIAVPVLLGDTEESLAARILRREHQLLPAVANALLDGRLRFDPSGHAELEGGLSISGVETGIEACILSPPAGAPR
jgi:phosphoribosylglycinamide formyltransferase-1